MFYEFIKKNNKCYKNMDTKMLIKLFFLILFLFKILTNKYHMLNE